MKVPEKDFPGITYFTVLVVEILKVEIGEIVIKNFEERSRGPSQKT